MKTFKIVILCLGALSIASATPTPEARENSPQHSEYEYNYDNEAAQPSQAQEPAESASHYDAYIQDVQAAATGGGGSGKKGYSSGSGLRTIAVGSANQAKTALGNQAAAAYQAAYVAKNTLAQSAAQASATAQAALAGKQVILSGLEQQVRDAKVALQGEEMQLQQAKRSAQAAAQSAQQAMHQVNVIQAALNAAQATSENANEAASQAAGELGAQTAMVGAARQRLHTLQEQLHGVRIDFEATQSAARKAQAAAQQAQANAAAAAAKAAAAGLGGGQHDASHEEWSSPIVEVHHVHQTSAKPFHRHHHRNPSKPLLTYEFSGSASEPNEVENLPVTVQSHSDHPHNALSHFEYNSSPTTQVSYELSSSASEQSELDVQSPDKSYEEEIVSIPAQSQSKQKASSHLNYSSPKPQLELSSPTPKNIKTSTQSPESNLIEIKPASTQSHHNHPLQAFVYNNNNVSLSKPLLQFKPIRFAPEHTKPNLRQPEYNTFELIPIPVAVEQSVRLPLQSNSNYPPKAFVPQTYSVQKPQITIQPGRLAGEHSRYVKTESNQIQMAPVENPNRLPVKSHINHPLRAYNKYPLQYTPQVAVVDNVNSQTNAYSVMVPYKGGHRFIDTRKRSAAKYLPLW